MKTEIIIIALALITAGAVYSYVALDYEGRLADVDREIDAKSFELIDIWNAPPPTPAPQTPAPPIPEAVTDTEFCLTCHDKAQTASFHYPDKIKALEEERGFPVRICTSCHGEPVMPVHFPLMQDKAVKCEACHIRGGGGFEVPLKKEGDLLVCQLCHARGNYITIHIDGDILQDAEIDSQWIRSRGGGECTLCHNEALYGGKNILTIHGESALGSGSLSPRFTPAPSRLAVEEVDLAEMLAVELAEQASEAASLNETPVETPPPTVKPVVPPSTEPPVNETLDLNETVEPPEVTASPGDWSNPKEPTTSVEIG
jgi:hypothetical protein